jgi:hypothetical protein
MPELGIEFSKYDVIAVIIPGALILMGIMTLLPKTLYADLYSIFVTEGAYLFIFALAVVVFSFIFGKISSKMSYWIIEARIVEPKDETNESEKKGKTRRLGYNSSNMFLTDDEFKQFKRFKKYRKPATKDFQEKVRKAYKYFFKEDLIEESYFPLIFVFIKEHCSESASRVITFSAMYHCFRNLTLIFSTFSFAIGFTHAYQMSSILLYVITPVASIIIALICFRGYLKYYKIFSNEIISSFVVFYYSDKGKKIKKDTQIIY